jgi:hypothetical protein
MSFPLTKRQAIGMVIKGLIKIVYQKTLPIKSMEQVMVKFNFSRH